MKLDENNQYGNAMTKPLPTGCIKDDEDISWETFNFLLESVGFEDEIGHLYIVDIEFNVKNATEREYAYNETYPPIIEKQKTIDPCERSVFQLLEQFVRGEKVPKAYRATAKAHANLFKKIFSPNNIFDEKVSKFVTSDLLKSQIEEQYNDKLMKLDKEDKFYEIKLQTLKTLEALTNQRVKKKSN